MPNALFLLFLFLFFTGIFLFISGIQMTTENKAAKLLSLSIGIVLILATIIAGILTLINVILYY